MIDRFDAVFFDNDGVLVDTEPLFLRATQELLATVDVHIRAQDYHDLSMKQGRSVFELATAKGISDEAILDLRARRSERYSELIDEGVRVLDGVREALGALHGQRPLAIVTSSDRGHFDQIHGQTDLTRYFEFIVAAGDYRQHKPHPEPYLVAAKQLGVPPERCLVIEDTERGLVAADAAGMACIVIPNALSETGDFARARARLDSMAELAGLLGLE